MRGGSHPALGIDFGTSNSAVSYIGPDGVARLVPLEGSATALPTAVFFNSEDRSTHFGRDAIALYMAGVEGRLMRSLKSLLGSRLLEDETAVGDGVLNFRAIISRFLGELRGRAGRHLDHEPHRVVIGRPVHFVDGDSERDRHASRRWRRRRRLRASPKFRSSSNRSPPPWITNAGSHVNPWC